MLLHFHGEVEPHPDVVLWLTRKWWLPVPGIDDGLATLDRAESVVYLKGSGRSRESVDEGAD